MVLATRAFFGGVNFEARANVKVKVGSGAASRKQLSMGVMTVGKQGGVGYPTVITGTRLDLTPASCLKAKKRHPILVGTINERPRLSGSKFSMRKGRMVLCVKQSPTSFKSP